MIFFIAAGFLAARIKGHRISPVFKDWSLYPLFTLEFIYIFLQINIFLENYSYLRWAPAIQTLFTAVLLIPIIKHKLYTQAFIGSALVLGGTALNKIAMAANDGMMPVYPTLSRLTGYFKANAIATGNDGVHILGDASTKLKLLTDYIDIGWTVFSIGDLLIHSFVTIVVFYTIRAASLKSARSA